jgi:protein TonB
MFDSFRTKASDVTRRKTLAASTLGATAAYLVAAVAVVSFARGAVVEDENVLDVTFEKQLPKEAPPPPPPPEPVKKAEKPKPPPPPTPTNLVPKEVPKEALPEGEPVANKPAFELPPEGLGGDSHATQAVVAAVATATAAPKKVAAPAPTAVGPVDLPEDAEPAVPSPDNISPEYPESARTAGKEGMVILKIVVLENGRVGEIKVLKGEPPFVEAALAAVRTYRFQPAMLAGRPISIFRIVKVPFRLSVGGG